ncbi:phosphonate ABC transporter, permease protein PhnE [bacterium]|nr:phosphonate ABC transporter, permease protein PhnE [bacterium]
MSYSFKRTVFDSVIFAYLALIALVVFLSPSEEQMLNMNYNFALAFVLVGVGCVVSILLNKSSKITLGQIIFAPSHKKDPSQTEAGFTKLWCWQLWMTLLVTILVGINQTKFSFYELTDPDGFAGAMRLFKGLASPNFGIFPLAVLKIIETIFIAFMATILAIPLAFILSFFCAKNIMTSRYGFMLYAFLRTVLNVTRSVEALIWAIIFSVWVGIGPFAGMLALCLHSVASLAKQYSEITEAVNEGPIEGIRSTGAGFLQTIWFAIVPQVILPYVAFTIYRWDINVRMATIIGLVGGGGIGTMLIKYQGQALWPEVGCIIVVIAAVVWLMDTASAYLREALK